MDSKNRIWVALDCEKSRAIDIAKSLRDHPAVLGFKLNRLIDAENFAPPNEPRLFESLTAFGKKLWADMKLIDIPETVKARVKAYADSGFFSHITVMAEGGHEMMSEAVEAAGEMKVIAVTKLTSLSPEEVIAINRREVAEMVLYLAKLAKFAEVGCLVCSGRELEILSDELVADLVKFVPGISPAWSLGDQADQKRTATPAYALSHGASALVIGRAIVKSCDPYNAVEQTAKEIEQA